jgi:mannose-6-phosphate isomerase-like protein (cupin superfamily)
LRPRRIAARRDLRDDRERCVDALAAELGVLSSSRATKGAGVNGKVNLAEKLGAFEDRWQPKIVARFNGSDVFVVKVKGEFVWHKHDETDDFFLVLEGHLTIQLRDRNVELDEGELFVVPRGVEHCPRADEEAHVLLIEPVGTPNTGDAGGPLTAEKEWI